MNFGSLKQAYRSKELRGRILIVLGLLVIFRLLAHVPVPVPDNNALATFLKTIFNSNKLLQFADVFSGSALSNFSIIMMGVGPYINASIIVQLLTYVVPQLEALSKEGEAGRRKITRYTRILTLPLAIAQSFAMIAIVKRTSQSLTGSSVIGNPSIFQWFLMVTTITAGSMLLMWIGEMITEQGIGNGISLIVFAGVVARIPSNAGQLASLGSGDTTKVIPLIVFFIITLLVVAFVVILNEGQRNIPVSYARRNQGSRAYSSVDTHLPLRVISAGVIPIIFALAFLSLPGILGTALSGAKSHWVAVTAKWLVANLSSTSLAYGILYFVFVIAFTYFYTSITFNSDQISEDLQKQGGFIPGIRPGKQTAEYLRRVMNRITLAGSVGIGFVAVLPFIAQAFTNSTVLSIGGTGLIIVVGVAIETLKAIEAQAITTSYENY